MFEKMLGIVFSIDICTLHRKSSKNVDLNICVHTWHLHSVSVKGHKQGFELAVPVMGISALKLVLRNIGNSQRNRRKTVEKLRQKGKIYFIKI